MKHLTDREFVDLLDGAPLSSDRLRHVERCERCRAQVEALRGALARTVTDDMPEPSPLYWDHFAARVSDAIRGETPAPPDAWADWRRKSLATWAAAASMAVLVMLTVVWRAPLHAPAPLRVPALATIAPTPATSQTVAAPEAIDDIEADEAWAVVRSAAEGLRWEEAHAVGLSVHPGAAEGIALELTADERSELGRLLDTEMKRSGV